MSMMFSLNLHNSHEGGFPYLSWSLFKFANAGFVRISSQEIFTLFGRNTSPMQESGGVFFMLLTFLLPGDTLILHAWQ